MYAQRSIRLKVDEFRPSPASPPIPSDLVNQCAVKESRVQLGVPAFADSARSAINAR